MNTNNKLGYREGVVSVVLNLLLFVLKYYAGYSVCFGGSYCGCMAYFI